MQVNAETPPPEMGQPPTLDEPPLVDEPYPGGWEDDALMCRLRAHGMMLEEILRRLPPAPGEEGGHRPGWPPAPGPPRAPFPREKLAEIALGDGPGRGEQRRGSLEGQSNCGPEGDDGGPVVVATTARRSLGLKGQNAELDSSVLRRPEGDLPRNQISSIIQQLVMNPAYDLFFGLLIIVNTMFMVVEEQFKGAIIGYDLGFYTSYYGSDQWADSTYNESLFEIVEVFFCVTFTVEVILRMVGMGSLYFRRPSEYFDLAVVILSDLSVVFSTSSMLENVQLMRLLRAAKLVRLLKLARTIEGFDALSLMTTALRSSAWALCWSALLLLSIMTFISIIVTETFRAVYLEEDVLSDEDRDELFEYWGTFNRSMLSLFELALANWSPICRWLVEHLHEGFMVAVISFKLVMGIAVIGVINAVFMQETFKVANTDDEMMVRMKTRATKQHSRKMEALFLAADKDGSGRIDRSECRAILKNESIRTWLASMDLVASDADVVFDLLRGQGDTVTKDELIHGISNLKGAARSIDMLWLLQTLETDPRGRERLIASVGRQPLQTPLR